MNIKFVLLTLATTTLISAGAVAQPDTVNQKREVYTIEGRSDIGIERTTSRIERTTERIERSIERTSDQVERTADRLDKSFNGRKYFYKSDKDDNNNKSSRSRNRSFGINKGHWAGVTLSYNGLISGLDNFSLPDDGEFLSQTPKSIGITVNPIDLFIPFNKNFGLVTGLGFEFNNFRFSKNIGLMNEDGIIKPDYQYEANGIKLIKSKLTTYYMNIPLLFEYKTAGRNEFFVNAGVVGGWRMGAHTKIKAKDPMLSGKFKNHGDLGLKNFHYGYTFNIGFEHVALSTTYYPGSIFREGKGPDVEQINIGISILW